MVGLEQSAHADHIVVRPSIHERLLDPAMIRLVGAGKIVDAVAGSLLALDPCCLDAEIAGRYFIGQADARGCLLEALTARVLIEARMVHRCTGIDPLPSADAGCNGTLQYGLPAWAGIAGKVRLRQARFCQGQRLWLSLALTI